MTAMVNWMPTLITPEDLAPFAVIPAAKAQSMIEDATAQALTAAPCLAGTAPGEDHLTYVQKLAVKGVLRAAILRWNEAGTGAKVTRQRSAGVFQESETLDTSTQRRGVFWPSEIRALQQVCKTTPSPYTVDMGAGAVSPHTPWCARSMGASYCDCGVDLGMEPDL